MAIIAPSYDKNRTNLRDVIPLTSPYTIQIEPTRMCNLRCFFCMHHSRGTSNDLLKESGFKIAHMDMDLYDKIVHDIMRFPQQPKMVNFCGIGEPLMNPRFGEMIRRLRAIGYSGRIITYTNGVLLTPAVVDELTNSGLSELRISLNGLTAEMYKHVTGVKISMEKYVENIRYLYENKKDTKIYIKIIENLLEQDNDREEFYQIFGNISDVMYVENLIQLQRQMKDYGGITEENYKNVFNEPMARDWKTCACMFYQMHIDADGYVFFCVSLGNPSKFAIGNIKENSLDEIWNGRERLKALRTNLRNGSDSIPMCVNCEGKYDIISNEEFLDDSSQMLLDRLPGDD
ncbi:radical SAM protein [Heliophilum fasciatum]|uniref:MoaA/NifB/PqqE/SkfB family radical SAM enzyme n=1 Tax=Heliophilum fasciatum TaxID=35700 RepID=A0A4R2RP43_9FIRM|nr:radical SAM protein [Heliophilum fasciatum]MCW2278807.1 MoaA/NifB/PqqE/SkfB family radical SAM enzyme [Heliophilum fasciatum]TCP64107.1 MoaA/NifB/PqqE/SkfB family radical SAM enzyme [Heliophilum fasciatum]